MSDKNSKPSTPAGKATNVPGNTTTIKQGSILPTFQAPPPPPKTTK